MNKIKIPSIRYNILSPIDFLYYVEKHKEKFRYYCEVIITVDGDIMLPFYMGHIELLWELAKTLIPGVTDKEYMNNGLFELLTLTKAICVSYDYQIIIDDFYSDIQKDVYNLLVTNSLIAPNLKRAKPKKFEFWRKP